MRKMILTFMFLASIPFSVISALRPTIELDAEQIALMNTLSCRAYDDAQHEYSQRADVVTEEIKETINGVKWVRRAFHTKKPDAPSAEGAVFYSPEQKKLVMAFHGSKWIEDWLVNFKVHTRPANELHPFLRGQVHQGFSQTVLDCYKDILEQVRYLLGRELMSTDEIFFTGHSLGGALACMAAIKFAKELNSEKNHVRLITFSAPRGGNEEFVGSLHESLSQKNILNFLVYTDLVPFIPPAFLGYERFGISIQMPMLGRVIDHYMNPPLRHADDVVRHPIAKIIYTYGGSKLAYWLGLGALPAFGIGAVAQLWLIFHSQQHDASIRSTFEKIQHSYFSDTSKSLDEVGKWHFWSLRDNALFNRFFK